MMELAKSKEPTKQGDVPIVAGYPTDAASNAYMQAGQEPVRSSVLTSNSIYLSSPVYRDAFAHQALRRHGHDLPTTYNVPAMRRAINELTDPAEVLQLIAQEKARSPEFAAWLDARTFTNYGKLDLTGYAPGTLGAAILDFQQQGFDVHLGRDVEEITDDLDYILKRRGAGHDIEHMVTGLGPNTAGEAALALTNVYSTASYFTPAFAHFLSHGLFFVAAGGIMRTALHYHDVLPTYLEGVEQGIRIGRELRKPLMMVDWEDYLDWQLADIAADLGITQRGPEAEWDWTTEAAMG
jgi:ubiquinone biosynthesis protein COQ4